MIAALEHASNGDQVRLVLGLVLMTFGLSFLLTR